MKNVQKFSFSIFFCLIVFNVSYNLIAQEKTSTPTSQKENRRTYTDAEFEAAVEQELEKKMKRLGQGSLIEFSKELLQKEEELKLKELNIKKQSEELDLSRKEIQKQIAEFVERQKTFLSCIDDIDKKESERINHMVEVIAGMRPNTAAEVLSVQDAKISVQILGKLDPQRVSKIFNLMDKEISARLQKQYMTMKK